MMLLIQQMTFLLEDSALLTQSGEYVCKDHISLERNGPNAEFVGIVQRKCSHGLGYSWFILTSLNYLIVLK